MVEFPEEWEFIEFFGVTPVYRWDDSPWPYTDATFTVERDGRPLRVTMNAPYGDLDIDWGSPDDEGLHLNLRRIRAFRLEEAHGHPVMVVYFEESLPVSALTLRIDPSVRLVWSMQPH